MMTTDWQWALLKKAGPATVKWAVPMGKDGPITKEQSNLTKIMDQIAVAYEQMAAADHLKVKT